MTTPDMAPGVRVSEVSPGGPVAGVGTNTAALVGTTLRGEPGAPTLVLSWDAFVRRFGDGGPIPSSSRVFARAVYGFFANGRAAAYVLRVSSGVQAGVAVPSRAAGANPPPALSVVAVPEGGAGNDLRVAVSDSSLLADRLTAAGAPAGTLAVTTPQTTVAGHADGRQVLQVGSTAGFAAGDRLQVRRDGVNPRDAVMQAVEGPGTLRLAAALPGNTDYTGGTVQARTVPAGRRELTLDVPAGLRLSATVPAGSLVRLTANGVDERHVVVGTGARSVVLDRPTTADLDVTAAPPPTLATLEFTVVVSRGAGPAEETFAFLSTTPGHPRYWRNAVASERIRLVEPDAPPPGGVDPRPATGAYDLAGGTDDDPDAAWARIVGDATTLAPLDRLDDVSLVCVPGLTDAPAQQAIVDHCERHRDRFALLDPPERTDVQQIQVHRDLLATRAGYAALYWPNILIRNTAAGTTELQPPSGHLAGVFSRSDERYGVHKAPANEPVVGAVGLEVAVTDGDQALLNDRLGINALRSFKGGPPLVWGARTLADDRSYQFVNVRRLMIFLEESLRTGLQQAVFAPNDLGLWRRLERIVRGFLTRVWRDGALFGATPDDAFTIQIDERNNSEEDRRNGILRIWIFVRPTYTAEHILVDIGLLVGESA